MTTPSYYTVIYFLHPKNKLYLDSKGIEGFSVLNTVFFLNSEELQYTCTVYLQQGAKKVGFMAYHSGKLLLVCTSQKSLLSSPKNLWWEALITVIFFCNLNFPKNFTCPLGKLRTGFTGSIAKFTSPGLSDTTLFAR